MSCAINTVGNIHVAATLRDVTSPFRDRAHAGRFLAGIVPVTAYRDPLLVAVSSGGYEVAAAMATADGVPVELGSAVSLVPAWTSQVVYGAVAFDGSVVLDDGMIETLGLGSADVREAIAAGARAAQERAGQHGTPPALANLHGRTAIMVDDGDAPVLTLCAAIAAVRNAGAVDVVIATVVAGPHELRRLVHHANPVYCAVQRRRGDDSVFDDAASGAVRSAVAMARRGACEPGTAASAPPARCDDRTGVVDRFAGMSPSPRAADRPLSFRRQRRSFRIG